MPSAATPTPNPLPVSDPVPKGREHTAPVTTVDAEVIVQADASEAKPTPLTTIDWPSVLTDGEIAINGFTVKVDVPLSTPHVTVIVYGPLPAPPGPFPTLKKPCTVKGGSLKTWAMALPASIGIPPGPLPVIEQIVPAAAVAPVAPTTIPSPDLPEATLKLTARSAP